MSPAGAKHGTLRKRLRVWKVVWTQECQLFIWCDRPGESSLQKDWTRFDCTWAVVIFRVKWRVFVNLFVCFDRRVRAVFKKRLLVTTSGLTTWASVTTPHAINRICINGVYLSNTWPGFSSLIQIFKHMHLNLKTSGISRNNWSEIAWESVQNSECCVWAQEIHSMKQVFKFKIKLQQENVKSHLGITRRNPLRIDPKPNGKHVIFPD